MPLLPPIAETWPSALRAHQGGVHRIHLFRGSKAQLLTPLKNRAEQVSLGFCDLSSYAFRSCFMILLGVGFHSPSDSWTRVYVRSEN